MTLKQLAQWRLVNQQISVHDFSKPAELVAWMGAMQAQDFAMARWAVGIRMPDTNLVAIQKAIDKGEIIRTHVMRPTWHFVSSRDASWLLDLTAPHIKRSLPARLTELELTDAVLRKSLTIIEKALAREKYLTRDELFAALEMNRISTKAQRGVHILHWAELEKLICSGPIKGRKNTYALFAERVRRSVSFTRDEGLTHLASRYFTSHGPATLEDFLNWSGLPRADGRKAIGFISDEFLSENANGQTYWFRDTSHRVPTQKMSAYLLPAFDEFIIGYKDRSAVLPAANKATVISVNGIFWPVIVINGMVTGLWKRTITKEDVKVELDFFPGSTAQKQRGIKKPLAAAIDQVRAFFHPETPDL